MSLHLKTMSSNNEPCRATINPADPSLRPSQVHLRVAMEILGHSQIRLTMEVYTHVASELQRDAAARVQDLLG